MKGGGLSFAILKRTIDASLLANLPLKALGRYAKEVFKWLEDIGCGAFITIDF